MYPNEIDRFTEKLNKLENNTYVIEEEVTLLNGMYEGELQHDNVSTTSVRVYTGSKLTGDKIDNFVLSTPSLTPWKKIIKIFSDKTKVYITYETQGDTIEADDINILQNSIVNTQKALNSEIYRSTNAEKNITDNLNTEISRAKSNENIITDNLNSEINRAKDAEKILTDNLSVEINRAKDSESILNNNLNLYKESNNAEVQRLKEKDIDLDNRKSDKTYVDIEFNKRYLKEEVYNKDEVLKKIQDLIGTAPQVLDTFKEVADALGNDPHFATTIMNLLSNKVDKVYGKQLSTEDYSTSEKQKLTSIQDNANNYIHPATHPGSIIIEDSMHRFTNDTDKALLEDVNNKKHEHSNKSILDKITQILIDSWNSAVEHVSDSIRHITDNERKLWNTVSNKVDAINGKILSTNDFDNNYKSKVDSIESGANKYIHPNDANSRHVTDIEKESWNSKATGNHVHDDRYYTETEINNLIGVEELSTTKKTLKGAINEVKSIVTTGGSVDNADKLDGKHASDFALIGHMHTKNGISDFAHNHTANEIMGLPTSLPASGGTSDGVNFIDNRSAVDKPSDLQGRKLTCSFKYRSSVGTPPVKASGDYVYILNIVGWGANEGSGGWPAQIALGIEGLAYRQALDANTWGAWIKLSNATDKKVFTWNDLKGV